MAANKPSPYDKETMRARLDELNGIVEGIRAVSGPLREKRDIAVQAARKDEDLMNAEIAKAEKGLFDLEQERSVLARALGGRSASQVEAEPEANAAAGS